MKKYEIVKRKEEFNDIINHSSFKKSENFVIYIRKGNFEFPRFGIAISKKAGVAVIRNKLKRQVRSIIDNNKEIFKKHTDYIIMIKKSCLNLTYQEMNDALIKLIKDEEKL